MSDHQIPIPGPEHQVLSRMLGEWEGSETLMPSPWSPEEQQRVGRYTTRSLDGFFTISDYEQLAGDEVTFRGHGVYSWCPDKEQFQMFWLDSMGGGGGIATGSLTGDVLTFVNEHSGGHHRYQYTLGADDQEFEMAMSEDGENWNTVMVGRYRRV